MTSKIKAYFRLHVWDIKKDKRNELSDAIYKSLRKKDLSDMDKLKALESASLRFGDYMAKKELDLRKSHLEAERVHDQINVFNLKYQLK